MKADKCEKATRWQIKVTLHKILDSKTFSEIEEMVMQGMPAAAAIKILLEERRALAAEVEMLREYKTLTKDLRGTRKGPARDLPGTSGRSRTDGDTSSDEEVFNFMEGF